MDYSLFRLAVVYKNAAYKLAIVMGAWGGHRAYAAAVVVSVVAHWSLGLGRN